MKRLGLLVVLATALTTPTLLVRADATSDAKKAIQAQMDKSDAAAAKKDLKGAFSIFAPNFEASDSTGKKASVEMMKAQFQQIFTVAKKVEGKTKITKFALKGSEASVESQSTMNIHIPNPQNGGKISKLVINGTSAQVWVKKGSAWLMRSTKSIKSTATIDGKTINVPGNGG